MAGEGGAIYLYFYNLDLQYNRYNTQYTIDLLLQ